VRKSWDRGVDYTHTYSRILSLIRRARTAKQRCAFAVALIQLRNGARASEALRAYDIWRQTGEVVINVHVSKKKKEEYRLMVIPEEIRGLRECIDVEVGYHTYRTLIYKKLGINTHSLRYSFITHLLKMGVNPAIIAKITKHSKLDFILTYTQEKAAEDILRSL
jgi:Phage integrase family.